MLSSVPGSTGALQGQIKREQSELNDWVTCVSAKTPKGKAEIQKISGEINAAKEQVARIESTQASGSASASDPVKFQAGHSEARGPGLLIDAWA
jgi:hypothetical protein